MDYKIVNVPALTRYEAGEFRKELITALCNPGIEFDLGTPEGEADEKAYRAKLAEVDAHLKTFEE